MTTCSSVDFIVLVAALHASLIYSQFSGCKEQLNFLSPKAALVLNFNFVSCLIKIAIMVSDSKQQQQQVSKLIY